MYCLAMEQAGWEQRLTRTIASEVRRIRLARKLSAQKLADRCARLGFPVPRSVIANLENGYRDSVSVAELLILAFALDIAPVLLTAPLGHQPRTEILPGRELLTWDAVLWQSGETQMPADPDDQESDWLDLGDAQASVPLHHRHDQIVEDLTDMHEERLIVPGPDGAPDMAQSAKLWRQMRKSSETQLREVRARMRELDLTPPPLPAGLAYIEQEDQ
jgi:transcriptional regulator with XRE-family HTH domain